MILRKLLFLLGCSASLLGSVDHSQEMTTPSPSMSRNKSSCCDSIGALSLSRHHANKTKNPKFSCIQLDFSDVATTQTSTDTAAPGVGPDFSTRILGIPSNRSIAKYSTSSKVIKTPPGIYSIRCCDIVDIISIDGDLGIGDESIGSSIGFITFYYSLDRGVTWNKIIAGTSATVEFLSSNYFNDDFPYSVNIRFPPVETLVTVKKGDSITFAYSLEPVNQPNTTVLRNFSGRFIVEQITSSHR